ncbi:MAG: N-methyl-L-tryptophan oxidase [Gemmatimonadaceae bacterium]
MAARYDVIIAGLGAMGSATAAHLALRGERVLGLERWTPGHKFGSSHGDSRMIREMYFEHPMYVPLLQRAYYLWEELGRRVKSELLHTIGGLMIGRRDGRLVSGTLRSAAEHGLDHEILEPAEVARRFPAFKLDGELVAVLDPRAGYLDPDVCNEAHRLVATESGANLRFEEPLLGWKATNDGVVANTSRGRYEADHLVLAVGARTVPLLGLNVPLEVERQSLFWLQPGTRQNYEPARFPVYAYEYTPGAICYGFPELLRGVKASVMHSGAIAADAYDVTRVVGDDEAEPLRQALAPVLPELSRAPVRESEVCLFTNTPDHDFIVDFHPDQPRVLVSSACSGHGFKFSSVIGEIQADMVMHGSSRFDLSPFRITRFNPAAN